MATWQNRRWILRVNCRATSLAMFGDTVVRERIEISGRAHWGGDGSGIVPSLSRAEFKSHFLFDSHCCLISRGLRAGRWTKISRAWIIPMERQFGGSRKKRSFSFSLSACGHEGVWLFSCSLFLADPSDGYLTFSMQSCTFCTQDGSLRRFEASTATFLIIGACKTTLRAWKKLVWAFRDVLALLTALFMVLGINLPGRVVDFKTLQARTAPGPKPEPGRSFSICWIGLG